jgi:hypothetical protein
MIKATWIAFADWLIMCGQSKSAPFFRSKRNGKQWKKAKSAQAVRVWDSEWEIETERERGYRETMSERASEREKLCVCVCVCVCVCMSVFAWEKKKIEKKKIANLNNNTNNNKTLTMTTTRAHLGSAYHNYDPSRSY